MEENKNVSKNSWKRIFKKKWFFPAVYLAVAALLLTGVLWYQSVVNQVPDMADDMEEQLDDLSKGNDGAGEEEDATTVMSQQEVLELPVTEDLQVEIVTKFYDYGADESEQESALILHQNKYYQSDGIALSTSDHQSFDVVASLSGTVTEVKQDPLLGNVVKLEHEQGISTYYASLEEIFAEEGNEVEQGETIGTAGQNTLGQDNGVHVHFEVRKDGVPVNPESFVNEPINKIVAPEDDEREPEEQEERADSDVDEEQEQEHEQEQEQEQEQQQDQESPDDSADVESESEPESSRAMEEA
ncbi:M23 family metallopeptidase [Gracilibacillus sp. S3-1-1]|uniref:M23 family metallopeptidase n=1 Tax=Gracilibacillus pellucidus TaxID=3095368 RepID=A0ACC6M9J1_9BACI|nr:M23 family metallopeptidase [Gracilibacillus sp. S3-1-1]MDX8047619.1 M23 family metallopeptidase [Gracilibacillus sp. S3-1-1]